MKFKINVTKALATFLSCTMLTTTTMPVFAETKDSGLSGEYSITVVPCITTSSDTEERTPGDGSEIDIDKLPAGAKVDRTIRNFELINVDVDGKVLTDNSIHLKASTDKNDGSSIYAKFDNLPAGYYKVIPIYEDGFEGVNEFLVQLPMTSTNGTIIEDVYVYPKDYFPDDGNGEPNEPGDKLYPTSLIINKTDSKNSNSNLKDAKFKIYYENAAGEFVAVSKTENDDTSTSEWTTGDNGSVTITGLPYGTYYIVETSAPTGYLLDQEPVKVELKNENEGKTVNKNITNDKELTVKKDVVATNLASNVNWKITADIPSKKENLLTFVITDIYSGIEITDNNTTLVALDSDGTEILNFVKNTDYITHDDAQKSEYTITLTKSGLEKISKNANITSIKASISSTINDNSNPTISNKASINYDYAYDKDTNTDPDSNDPLPDITDIPDPDIKYPEPTHGDNNEENNPPKVEYPGGSEDPDNPNPDTEKEVTITAKSLTINNIDEDGKPLTGGIFNILDSEGNIVVKGVTAGTTIKIADGSYKLVQTEAPNKSDNTGSKYDINKSVVDFEVVDDTNTVTFTNSEKDKIFDLPFTGTTSMIIFTICGIIIMTVSIFLFIIIFRKKKEEDKEESTRS